MDMMRVMGLAMNARIRSLLASSIFNILAVDDLIRFTNEENFHQIQKTEEYKTLRLLHATFFDKISSELKDKIPELIMTCVRFKPEPVAPKRSWWQIFSKDKHDQ